MRGLVDIEDVVRADFNRDVLPHKEVKRMEDGTERVVETPLPGQASYSVTLKSGAVIGVDAETYDTLVEELRKRRKK